MSRDVQLLKNAFSMVMDFRHPRGRRYSLQAILMLTGLAMMNGAQSEQEVVDWTEREGRRLLDQIGIRRRRGPSLATLHRVFRGIDRRQLSSALETLNAEGEAVSACEVQDRHAAAVPEFKKENFDLMLESLARENREAKQHLSETGLKIWGVDVDRESSEWRAL